MCIGLYLWSFTLMLSSYYKRKGWKRELVVIVLGCPLVTCWTTVWKWDIMSNNPLLWPYKAYFSPNSISVSFKYSLFFKRQRSPFVMLIPAVPVPGGRYTRILWNQSLIMYNIMDLYARFIGIQNWQSWPIGENRSSWWSMYSTVCHRTPSTWTVWA